MHLEKFWASGNDVVGPAGAAAQANKVAFQATGTALRYGSHPIHPNGAGHWLQRFGVIRGSLAGGSEP